MTMPMTMGNGTSMANPDVCLTPDPVLGTPVPVVYPNVASNSTAVPNYYTIMIDGSPQLNTASMNATTSGDEAGVYGGVTSGTIMGPCRPVSGSSVNYVGGMPVWLLTKTTTQNVNNASGITSVPSQNFITVLR